MINVNSPLFALRFLGTMTFALGGILMVFAAWRAFVTGDSEAAGADATVGAAAFVASVVINFVLLFVNNRDDNKAARGTRRG